MTEQRTFATFGVDLPDDSEFTNSGEIAIPAGRGLCQALTHALELRDFKVPEWNQHEFYGWQTTVELGSQKCWLLLQGGEPWLLIAENKNGILRWINKSKTAFYEVLIAIDTALKGDERFTNVLWFTREEYEKGNSIGSPVP